MSKVWLMWYQLISHDAPYQFLRIIYHFKQNAEISHISLQLLSPEIFYLISPSDPCYPVSYQGWFITHLSPKGPPQSPKVTKNATNMTWSCLTSFLMGKEDYNHLKSITCYVIPFCLTPFCPTLSK